MPGLAELAIGTAPLLGGVLFGAAAGNLRGPDVRAGIRADMDLLDRLPAEQTERRAALQRSIDARIDDLVAADDQRRLLRTAALSYRGNWRDIVLFACSVLFTIVWWHVDHDRANWWVMFVALVVFSVLTAAYTAAGIVRALAGVLRGR